MLVLSQDQHILMESARGAIGASSPVSAFRKLRSDAAGEGFSRAFWRECAELGWTGVLVPEDYGGIDFGVVGAGVIARELARRLAPSPFLSTSVLAASALSRFGSDALRSEWLPRIARGMVVVGVSGDSAPPTVRSTRHGEGWSLAGLQPLVLDGHVADAFLIEAHGAKDGPALYLVRADASGVTRDMRTLVDGRRVATVRLEDAAVDPIAQLRGGADAREAVLDVGRAVVSAALCGVAEEAFASTMSYLKERKQFDRKIGSFQALQHRAARMHVDIENAWSASLKAMEALDARANSARFDVAVAKAKASETACTATAECLQMHGGIGMTDEFDIGLYLKRARVDSVLFGDAAFHADRVATLLGY